MVLKNQKIFPSSLLNFVLNFYIFSHFQALACATNPHATFFVSNLNPWISLILLRINAFFLHVRISFRFCII